LALKLEIYTPSKDYLKKEVEMVIAPGVLGEVGFLPRHTPFLTLIKEGKVRYKVEENWKELLIKEGFLEVNFDKVTILTDEVVEDKG
jgi:F-type H+-transporting ATPase subunit epsilon